MRKLKNILFLALIMIIASASMAFAARSEYVEGRRVYDYAGLFSYSEEEALEEYALSIEEDAKAEFYVLTIDDAEGKSAMEYADDFGDKGAFGYEEEYGTYIIMLIDMDNREIWISTSGKAIEYLNDGRIDKTLDAVFEYVSDGKYYEAAEVYLQFAYKYMLSEPVDNKYYPDDDYYPDYDNYDDTYYYDDGHYYNNETEASEIILICFLGSAVVSGIILFFMARNAKTKMTAGSTTYMSGSGPIINQRSDIYTHTTTVKRRIESNNSSTGGSRRSGGGSSVHRSSGGRSHGGGGRRF